jgi:predicted metal-binding protein
MNLLEVFDMKISIISCGNEKNDCKCAGVGCMGALNNRNAAFDCYNDEDIELVGYSDCVGCPTIYADEKILERVKPLVEFAKVEKIHFSSCMVRMCPFFKKYKEAIEKAYPDVKVILGTDAKPGQVGETTDTSNDITKEFEAFVEKTKLI